eukprot:TRINITY_DN3835_c0_g1_i1.p1 TRINITY_DN3835_c0_g1~~TRINITY_DN3835_c0_g1_i1.p1  ORF type:complete len:309 (-),score=43.53 TRINITY_DN3835_c0_g1_i1:68-994(-)
MATDKKEDKLWPKFAAGGLSSGISSGLMNPNDVIKVRLQLQNQLHRVSLTQFHHTGETMYKGFVHAFFKILREEGYFRGLMKGFTPSMMREFTYSSVRMGLYDPVKSMLAGLERGKHDHTLAEKIIAGGVSGAVGSAFATPTDVVKIRFQSILPHQTNPYRNTFHAFGTIYREEGGLRGLYKGMTPTIIRAAVLTSAQLASYDHTKRMLVRDFGYSEHDTSGHLLASIVSGLVTTTATNPVDIVKTRWMTDHTLYKGPLDCFIKIITREGPHALMKGWVPNYARLGPHFILSLPLNEFFRRLFGAEGL